MDAKQLIKSIQILDTLKEDQLKQDEKYAAGDTLLKAYVEIKALIKNALLQVEGQTNKLERIAAEKKDSLIGTLLQKLVLGERKITLDILNTLNKAHGVEILSTKEETRIILLKQEEK